MSTTCLICLGLSGGVDHHAECLKDLFAFERCPVVNLSASRLGVVIAQQSGRISISGVQPKLLVELSADRARLQPDDRGRYILKPQTSGFKHLPENEHMTMRLARLVGLPVPPNGLVRVASNGLAYVVKRFDRTDEGPPRKLRQEDFCSLSGRDPLDKYESSAEECAELAKRYSGHPEESLRQLFLLFAYSYWISNGDLHLKNLSLLEGSDGLLKLSPAYDLLSTRLYPQLKQVEALSLNRKNEQLARSDFIAFGEHCGLDAKQAGAMLDEMLALEDEAESLLRNSALPADGKREYLNWMKKKGKLLAREKGNTAFRGR